MQVAYVFSQAIIPAVVVFWINFGFARLTFGSGNSTSLFGFQFPIAGDLALTVFSVVMSDWFINCSLQTFDILMGVVDPLHPDAVSWWPAAGSDVEWWLRTTDFAFYFLKGEGSFIRIVYSNVLKSLPWAIVSFGIIWPITIAVCWTFFGNGSPGDPKLEVIFGAVGGIVAFVTTPIWAVMTLLSVGASIVAEDAAGLSSTSNLEDPLTRS